MTPMLEQYVYWKEQYPDSLLFFRMGDFYEMFFEDAHIASSVLDIALTSRSKNPKTPYPWPECPSIQ
jgi:DNA mismatch repair protein MutS